MNMKSNRSANIPYALQQWEATHDIPGAALSDLLAIMGVDVGSVAPASVATEAGLSKHRQGEVAKAGGILWRNNNGAAQDRTGRWIRYGLANTSAQLNRRVKSSDLIGITPVIITSDMVGGLVGVFTAEEIKKPGWKYTGTEREVAQLAFINLVIQHGGIARFVS